jgi:hypothetical protein
MGPRASTGRRHRPGGILEQKGPIMRIPRVRVPAALVAAACLANAVIGRRPRRPPEDRHRRMEGRRQPPAGPLRAAVRAGFEVSRVWATVLSLGKRTPGKKARPLHSPPESGTEAKASSGRCGSHGVLSALSGLGGAHPVARATLPVPAFRRSVWLAMRTWGPLGSPGPAW